MTLTPKSHLLDRVFHTDSEYMLYIGPALFFAKLLKKKTVNWPKMGLCIKACAAQKKIFPLQTRYVFLGFD